MHVSQSQEQKKREEENGFISAYCVYVCVRVRAASWQVGDS